MHDVIDSVIKDDGKSNNQTRSNQLGLSTKSYQLVKDIFLNGKSFAETKTSCVDIFANYPLKWEYPKLGLAKDDA